MNFEMKTMIVFYSGIFGDKIMRLVTTQHTIAKSRLHSTDKSNAAIYGISCMRK